MVAVTIHFPNSIDWNKMTPLEKAIKEFMLISEKSHELSRQISQNRSQRVELVEKMRSWGLTYEEIAKEVGLTRQSLNLMVKSEREARRRRDRSRELD